MAFKAMTNYVATAAKKPRNPVIQLYKTMSKEVPRVLTIYDADIPVEDARKNIQALFRKNAHIKDPQIIDMLVKKGYMELEETLMQWKQKTHLYRMLSPEEEAPRKLRKKLNSKEKFLSGLDDN